MEIHNLLNISFSEKPPSRKAFESAKIIMPLTYKDITFVKYHICKKRTSKSNNLEKCVQS